MELRVDPVYCWYESDEFRTAVLNRHLESRRVSLAAKAKRKEEKKAAGGYQIDMDKPHFEVGKKYFYSWSYDGDDYCSIIEVVGRTNCFVKFLQHDEEKRIKVYFDGKEEILSWGSLYHFRASNVCKSDEELEAERTQKEEEERARQEEEYRMVHENSELEIEECKRIEKEHPITGNEKFIIKVEWIEGYKDTCEYIEGHEFTLLAADMIFGMMDMSRVNMAGYDKCKFSIIMDGETVLVDRYDLGDGYGGLMGFLKGYDYSWIEDLRKERDAQAVGGQISSVEVAPYITEAIEFRKFVNLVTLTFSTVDELVGIAMKQPSIDKVKALIFQTSQVDQKKGEELYKRLKPYLEAMQ